MSRIESRRILSSDFTLFLSPVSSPPMYDLEELEWNENCMCVCEYEHNGERKSAKTGNAESGSLNRLFP